MQLFMAWHARVKTVIALLATQLRPGEHTLVIALLDMHGTKPAGARLVVPPGHTCDSSPGHTCDSRPVDVFRCTAPSRVHILVKFVLG